MMKIAAVFYAFCGQMRRIARNLISINCVHWADNNPYDVFASPLYDVKVTVWCGITITFILGPYFFEEVTDSDLQTCTVTSARYLDTLTHYAIPKLQR